MSRWAIFGAGLLAGGALAWLGSRALTPADEAWERYRTVRQFVRESSVRNASEESLDENALRGMLGGLDRYSRYYDPAEVRELERETAGRYRGIGVVLKRPIREGRVLFTLPGSPAERAGLRVGDTLLSIDGREFAALAEDEVRSELSKDVDAPVRLRVRGLDAQPRELEIARESLVEPTIHVESLVDRSGGIGHIAIHAFSRETSSEFDASFARLSAQGMRALVLDLRGNGGGLLRSAVEIAGRFVPEGTIVSTEGRRSRVVWSADAQRCTHPGYPLVVLVDEESASAAEVLAGALQEHRAAVVVGAPTWGKGTVQSIQQFPRWGSAAKVTTSYYFTPAHRNLEHGEEVDFGIAPDVLVEHTPEQSRRVRAWLARQPPPISALSELRAWEEAEHLTLVEEAPEDRQLAAALELFHGRRPDALASEGAR